MPLYIEMDGNKYYPNNMLGSLTKIAAEIELEHNLNELMFIKESGLISNEEFEACATELVKEAGILNIGKNLFTGLVKRTGSRIADIGTKAIQGTLNAIAPNAALTQQMAKETSATLARRAAERTALNSKALAAAGRGSAPLAKEVGNITKDIYQASRAAGKGRIASAIDAVKGGVNTWNTVGSTARAAGQNIVTPNAIPGMVSNGISKATNAGKQGFNWLKRKFTKAPASTAPTGTPLTQTGKQVVTVAPVATQAVQQAPVVQTAVASAPVQTTAAQTATQPSALSGFWNQMKNNPYAMGGAGLAGGMVLNNLTAPRSNHY